ncbi:hypothetical protein [Nostoc sp.]|uniref:hypothetical protein n=1 Tax=Nostoc sp. TaxID=1180 RepID=UPI002FF4CB84
MEKQFDDNLTIAGVDNITVDANNINEYPSLSSTGISLRKPYKGQEYELVYEYIQSKIPSGSSKQLKTVFVEPQIGSTFPDIVIVYFDISRAKYWSNTRPNLNKLEFQILHYIFNEKSVAKEQLEVFFPNGYSKSLKLLLEAELIDFKQGYWKTKPLKEIFGIRKLIAVEAKTTNWKQGLQQAFYNSYFASQSYLLLPHIPKTEDIFKQASRLGIGILTTNQSLVKSVLPAQVGKLPKSYVSWLFNEWAWKAKISRNAF